MGNIETSILGGIGFSDKGPVGGSFASKAQSSIYGGSVSKGSWLSSAQSTVMKR